MEIFIFYITPIIISVIFAFIIINITLYFVRDHISTKIILSDFNESRIESLKKNKEVEFENSRSKQVCSVRYGNTDFNNGNIHKFLLENMEKEFKGDTAITIKNTRVNVFIEFNKEENGIVFNIFCNILNLQGGTLGCLLVYKNETISNYFVNLPKKLRKDFKFKN